MKAELIDLMGDDLRVVNSARVSFDKESGYASSWYEQRGKYPEEKKLVGVITEKDEKLLNYLAKHGHWTPFSHVQITMRETVPIFVARQRFKHMVGFTYNEVSRRYVSDEPSFYVPEVWRKAAENKKQGSSDEVVKEITLHNDVEAWKDEPENAYHYFISMAQSFYKDLIDSGVAPEQARMVLPQSMMTSYYTTGSLAAWSRAYKQRIDEHSQKEIQDLAKQWGDIIGNIPELKHSWAALTQ